jgi:hypothetical protein
VPYVIFVELSVCRSRDGSVGITTGFTSCTTEFDSRHVLEVILFSTLSRPDLGPNESPIKLGALCPGENLSEREADF